MKRLLLALFALGLTTSAARTDWGGPGAPPKGGYGQPSGAPQVPQMGGNPNTLFGQGNAYSGTPDPYGLNPRLKRMFRLGTHKEPATVPPSYYYPQMGYGQGGPAYNPNGYPGGYGQAQGTLVFPHHPHIRSPRDFFMLDLNK